MAEQGATTALMRQYLDVKARYPDAIVFFRLGDFYEMFHEDAVYAARVCSSWRPRVHRSRSQPR